MSQLHSILTANHRPYAAVYADSAERLAATGFVRALGGGVVAFAADDLYKKALQLNDASEWVLTAVTPTWVQVSGAGSLANDSVTNALLANMAQATIKGRASGAGTGDPTDLTATQATAILNAMVGDSGAGGTKGLAPAPGAGDAAAGKFLKADGTYAVPATGGAGGIGDVVGPSSSVASEFMLFDGTTGKLAKRATGTGFVKATSGVYSTEANPVAGLPFELVVACSDLTTALTTGTAKNTFPWPRGVTLSSVHAFLVTPQTSGSTFTVDVNEAGSTILSTKITIDNGETDSTTAATAPVLSDTGLAVMAKMTVDIDQVGDGTARGLYLVFTGVYA